MGHSSGRPTSARASAGTAGSPRVEDVPTYGEHVDLLRAAGFAEVGTIWQSGDDRVLVAVLSA